MDIVEKVAQAIDEIPGSRSSYEIARVAIEEYQKALWTPYFDRPHGVVFIEHRRNWANSLTSHIMHIVGKYLCRHGEPDGAREASRDLFEALYESGAYIVTDTDRAAAGLDPRGPYGFTREEMKIMELKHREAMLRPLPTIVIPVS